MAASACGVLARQPSALRVKADGVSPTSASGGACAWIAKCATACCPRAARLAARRRHAARSARGARGRCKLARKECDRRPNSVAQKFKSSRARQPRRAEASSTRRAAISPRYRIAPHATSALHARAAAWRLESTRGLALSAGAAASPPSHASHTRLTGQLFLF